MHPPAPIGDHAALWLAKPTLALGGAPPARVPDMEATAAEDAEASAFLADRLPAGFLAIHPGSGALAKNWPLERFAELAGQLGPGPFLLVEGPAEAGAGLGLGEAPAFVRASQLPLRTLGAVLARAGLFVGNDSGVSHLAAAWGAPTLALFGPTDPGRGRRWAARSWWLGPPRPPWPTSPGRGRGSGARLRSPVPILR